jgi:hypothetical protein
MITKGQTDQTSNNDNRTIDLWKSVGITVKVQIGGTTVQIELREVTDKRRLYYVVYCESLKSEC